MIPSAARKRVLSILLSIIPLLVYVSILQFRVPYSLSHFFLSYSFPLLIIIFLLYYVCFLLPGRIRFLAVGCVTMLLFALPLSYKWTSGYSDATLIGGMIPYKDGFGYYGGAHFILGGDRIPGSSWTAAWRPLFPGFLSALLFLSMENLQWTLAALVGLLGVCCYFAAQEIRELMGAFEAAIFATLLYFFIQPILGTPLTETLGLALGCLAFILLLKSAQSRSIAFMLFGLITLMVGVSVRAGAFAVFPMLVLWAGWVFRNGKSFNFRIAVLTLACTIASYLLVNTVYTWVIVGPGGSNFGNFAYILYGQVMGGIGWTHAASDLGTINTDLIFQATFQEFLTHPSGFLIGAAKAYKDFFLPSSLGIFSFISTGGPTWLDIALWILGLSLLSIGLVHAIRHFHSTLNSLMVLAFAGILLSIPFMPPIDGGKRFYASTMPFFFTIVAYGFHALLPGRGKDPVKSNNLSVPHIHILSGLLLAMTFIMPALILIQRDASLPAIPAPSCQTDQVPFAIMMNSGSYIDLIPESSAECGYAPQICLSDFERNGAEKDIDDFYQTLVSLANETSTTTRLVPSTDTISGGLHFFIGLPGDLEPSSSEPFIAGCAIQIRTKHQSIYKVLRVLE